MTDDYKYDDETYGATITVIEAERVGRVTYTGDNGSRFRVLVRQKPNPIGFTAKWKSSR